MNRELTLLFLVDFIMSLGMNLTDSLRVLYIQSLGASVFQISMVVSITGMAGTLLRVPSGIFSDRYGRKGIIVTSILMCVSPPLLYTVSKGWEQLIPWGIVYSAAFALYMPSRMAIIADFTTVENRTKIYSMMGIAWPLGGMIGPAVGGFLQSKHGWNAIFYVASILFVVCLIPSLLLPKTPRCRLEDSKESHVESGSIPSLAFIRPLFAFIILNLFLGLGIGTTNSITPIYLTERFNVSTADVGLFISVSFGLTTILCQIPGGILAERFGRKRFIAVCLALEPFLFVFWTFVDSSLLLLLVQMGVNALWSMTWPATMSLLMDCASGSRRGVTSGFTQMGVMLGFTVGPTIGGYLWETMGMSFPYFASAFFFALCLPIVPLMARGRVLPLK